MQRTPSGARSGDAPLCARAFVQHGVITWWQLRDLGFSEAEILTRLARGSLIRIHRGVYAVGHARLTLRGRWLAAVFACGSGARLAHDDALALHGAQRPRAGVIHVVAGVRHRVDDVRCHVVRDLAALGGAVVDAIPVTSLERAVLDSAPRLSPQRLRTLLEEIERQNRFDRRRFDDLLAMSNGHRGVGRLRAALADLGDVAPFVASGLEIRFLELIRAAGLPEPAVNVVVAGERVDFFWAAAGVVVEIDSWRYHRSRRSFEDDRRRANAFVLAGFTVLRITEARIDADPSGVVAEVAAALTARGVMQPTPLSEG